LTISTALPPTSLALSPAYPTLSELALAAFFAASATSLAFSDSFALSAYSLAWLALSLA